MHCLLGFFAILDAGIPRRRPARMACRPKVDLVKYSNFLYLLRNSFSGRKLTVQIKLVGERKKPCPLYT